MESIQVDQNDGPDGSSLLLVRRQALNYKFEGATSPEDRRCTGEIVEHRPDKDRACHRAPGYLSVLIIHSDGLRLL